MFPLSASFPPRASARFLAACAAATTFAADGSPSGAHTLERVQRLDAVVVSAGPDPRTTFDLAQGTTVLAGEDLHRAVQATLGETLAGVPGVGSTYFGPGSNRPVIRGLGGDRVRVLDHGIGSLDASNVSPDHATLLEPLFASRIEVLRGPSALLYGSSAVGGAVNVIDRSIPDEAPDGRPRGAVELRAGGAARERTAVLTAGGGSQGFSAQVNALRRTTADLRIPGVARTDEEAPRRQPAGVLPNSASDTFSGSLGAGVFWKAGRAGAALAHHETTYGVPTGEDPATRLRMRQTRFEGEAELTGPLGLLRSARLRFGSGDYTHQEFSGEADIHTVFSNRAWEGRLELPHQPIGGVSGTVGAQASSSNFAAVGDEVATPPSVTASTALFALEEFRLGRWASFQLGARVEAQRITLGEVDAPPLRLPGYSARSGQRKTSAGASGSAGAVVYPAKDWSLATALAYTERLPTAQELFSNGPHAGTGTYEVGSTGLPNERSLGVDVSLRRRAGRVTGSIGAFVNRFHGYIFPEEMAAALVPPDRNPEGLTPVRYVARDARFIGAEAELAVHLLADRSRTLDLELMGDVVRAEETGGQPLPRIPARRYGVRLVHADDRWLASVEIRRTFRQDRIAHDESATDGYTLTNADLIWRVPGELRSYEFFVRGRNLTDATAREHGSFLKEFAPLPGRGVLFGARLMF